MTINLPEEILLLIFNNLFSHELSNCQGVCRSWYFPAHLSFLKSVFLIGSREIEQFITAIDRNPDQSYLNAVKKIHIFQRSDIRGKLTLEKDSFEKLFFRFPNLEEVWLHYQSLVGSFDQDLCKTFLLRCPKLDTFHVSEAIDGWDRALLKNVQPLLTNITYDDIVDMEQPVQFLTQFPRLKDVSLEVDTLVEILPLFEQLSNVEEFHLVLMSDNHITENAEEEYLQETSKEIRDQIIQRLSNVSELTLLLYYNPDNAIRFISKYFTGLKSLKVNRNFYWHGEDEDGDDATRLYYENMFNFINSVNGESSANTAFLQFEDFVNDLPFIIQNICKKESRALHLNVQSRRELCSSQAFIGYNSNPSSHFRSANISIDPSFSFDILPNLLSNEEPSMNNVDEFAFQLNRYPSMQALDTNTYISLLGTMPSLKKIKLDIPEYYTEAEGDVQSSNGAILLQVQEATFIATVHANFQSLLKHCSYMLPNLKTLEFYNFSGVQQSLFGDFQLDLQDYSLEKLIVDAKPVIDKVQKAMGFFAFEVQLLHSSNTRHMYKISLDLSSATVVNDRNLEGFEHHKNYPSVHLSVHNLKKLELFCTHKGMDSQRCIIMLDE